MAGKMGSMIKTMKTRQKEWLRKSKFERIIKKNALKYHREKLKR